MSDAYAELGPHVPQPPPPKLDADTALWIGLLMQNLNRVPTDAGSGDRAFLRELRGKHPDVLSDRQRQHVIRLAWRYRFQLRSALRLAHDPDLPPSKVPA